MKTVFMLCALCALVAFLCVSASAQKAMTRDEAIAVINKSISSLKGLTDTELGDVYVSSSITVHGSGLRYTLVIYPSGAKETSTITEDFDPALIEQAFIIEPTATNPVGTVSLFFSGKSVISNKVEPKEIVCVDFSQGDKNTGKTIQAAFGRLYEIYKAAKQP
jgi:hypothetical protein